jgi:hypothetical protein
MRCPVIQWLPSPSRAAMAGAGDSYKLADYLRTDGHRLRRLQPLDAGLRQLQSLVQRCRLRSSETHCASG